MVELEISVMGSDADADKLRPLLQAFEARNRIHVNVVAFPWDKGWSEIAKIGIYGSGPDISEVGTSWIGSLAAMATLRPFTAQETKEIGGETAFFENLWRTGFLPQDPTLWAIPWVSDLLVLYYWRDMLEKAGITNPESAFATHESFVDTLNKLQASGIPYPLCLAIVNTGCNLHDAASWIWGEGGDILSPDYRRVAFHEEAAMRGLKKYFSLHPYISSEILAGEYAEPFSSRAAATLIAGPYHGSLGRVHHPEWNGILGVAPLPEVAYVGGSSLAIWQHSRHPREAFELIRFLLSQSTQLMGSPHSNLLSVRREVFQTASMEQDVFHKTFSHALRTGRSFPTVRLWGSVEEKLNREITATWVDLFADPKQDVGACLRRHFEPLAQRLNNVLSG